MAGENGPLGGMFARDEWSKFPVALNMLANAIMANYPNNGVAQMVNQQYEIARANDVAMTQKEAQRQAEKEANRKKNRALAGTAVGAAAGGLAAPALGASVSSGISAGAGFGGGMASGDPSAAFSALGQLTPAASKVAPPAPDLSSALEAPMLVAPTFNSIKQQRRTNYYTDPYAGM